jgi:hypothetical protein
MASQPCHPTRSRSRPRSETAFRVEALLNRYPNLGEQELAELIETFPRLHIRDYALMTGDDRLADKLETFEREHGHELKTPLGSLLAFLAFPAILAGGVLWWLLRPWLGL